MEVRGGFWAARGRATPPNLEEPRAPSRGRFSHPPSYAAATPALGAARRAGQSSLLSRMTATYDGYTSCPLVAGYGGLILAEFAYGLLPQATFPFDQAEEHYSVYALKAYGLPAMYWNGTLRGRM